MPDQKAATPPDQGLIPADADVRRGNSREEPAVTDREWQQILDLFDRHYPGEPNDDARALIDGVKGLVLQAHREGREEAMKTMKPELYRLAGVETRARRAGGNIRAWAEDIRDELRKPGRDRHISGHLHRIIAEAERLLDQPAPSGAEE